LGLFCICVGFHCHTCDCVRCDNGVTSGVVNGTDQASRVTGLKMPQKQKHDQVPITYLLFANVAKTEIWSEFRNVLIVCKCCSVMVRLLLCCSIYGHYCAL
jgi:hypothetical protein